MFEFKFKVNGIFNICHWRMIHRITIFMIDVLIERKIPANELLPSRLIIYLKNKHEKKNNNGSMNCQFCGFIKSIHSITVCASAKPCTLYNVLSYIQRRTKPFN